MNRIVRFIAIFAVLSRSALTASEPIAPSCGMVNQELAPCLGFIKSSTNQPSAACCTGAKAIGSQAKTQGDRQAICECIKKVLAVAGQYDKNRIPEIPKQCGVSVTLPPIDSSTDCSKAFTKYIF